jgi:hypothetical protein
MARRCFELRPSRYTNEVSQRKGGNGLLDQFAPELQLAVACCRFPPDDDGARAAVAKAAAQVSSWPVFEALVGRHRIDGLANLALADCQAVPREVRARLAGRARERAAFDLLLAASTIRLQQRFDEAGLPALFIKGAAVGVLAFGGLGIKRSWDIDLLTTADCVEPALQLLEREGFRLESPSGLGAEGLRRFVRFYHEAVLRDARGVPVELHWRLSGKPHLLPGVTARSQHQTVDLGGQQVRTLGDDLLIPYLIAHGQEHGWSRLKWLADLNALLSRRPVEEIERLSLGAETLGVGDSASAALFLCSRLLGLRLPPNLEARLSRRAVQRLVRTDLACIAHPYGGSDLPIMSRANLALLASRVRSATGWRGVASELGAIWIQPAVRARFPVHLNFLYHILRIPLFLAGLPLKLRALRRAARAGRIP